MFGRSLEKLTKLLLMHGWIFSSISINHCFREANQAADFSAHKGHSIWTPHHWFELHDLMFLSIIQKDVLSTKKIIDTQINTFPYQYY